MRRQTTNRKTVLPRDQSDAEAFYKTLEVFSLAAIAGARDPWSEVGDHAEETHIQIIKMLLKGKPEDRAEVQAFLSACANYVTLGEQNIPSSNVIALAPRTAR